MAMDAEHDSGMPTGESDFDVVMRGYNRHQVDEFVSRTRSELGDLEQRLAVSRRETERVRKELAAARSELDVAHQANKPAHAAVSERLSQILRLAAEEADQEKAAAEATIAEMRSEAAAQVDRMRTEAGNESERLLSSAREQSERTLADARDEAARLLSSSRDEASRLVSSSREEAERTVSSAKEHAHRVVSAAERRAVAVTDVANRRLAGLTERHTKTVERLSEIREALVGLLAEEAATGSLEDEVQRMAGPAVETTLGERETAAPAADVVATPTAEPADATSVDPHADGTADPGPGAPDRGRATVQPAAHPTARTPLGGPRVAETSPFVRAPRPAAVADQEPAVAATGPIAVPVAGVRSVPRSVIGPAGGETSEGSEGSEGSERDTGPDAGPDVDGPGVDPSATAGVDPAADVLEPTDDGESVSSGPRPH